MTVHRPGLSVVHVCDSCGWTEYRCTPSLDAKRVALPLGWTRDADGDHCSRPRCPHRDPNLPGPPPHDGLPIPYGPNVEHWRMAERIAAEEGWGA